MIFLCRTFKGQEAVDVGLINKCVPQDQLYDETMKWVKQINSYSGQTIRQTKKSLNAESDNLYDSTILLKASVSLSINFRSLYFKF